MSIWQKIHSIKDVFLKNFQKFSDNLLTEHLLGAPSVSHM